MYKEYLKKFVEEHIELIDTLHIDELYEELSNSDVPVFDYKELFETLILCNVDVLKHVNKVHDQMFYEYDEEELRLPQNITCIGQQAFENSSIQRLYIEGKLTYVDTWAFSFMNYLKEIHFSQTLDEVRKLLHSFNFLEENIKIICIDGVTES